MSRTNGNKKVNVLLDGIRKSMIRSVQSVNNGLSERHLKGLTDIELLNNCSPDIRVDYAKSLYKERVITEEQAEEYFNTAKF